jgi:hypothetical protein
MNPVSEQEIAEFIKHFQNMDASEEEPLKEDEVRSCTRRLRILRSNWGTT